jgi:hypothetical protein
MDVLGAQCMESTVMDRRGVRWHDRGCAGTHTDVAVHGVRTYSRDWINEVDYPPYPTGTAANTHARIMLYLSDLYALAQETPADKSIELPDYYHHSPCDTIVFKEWETRLHRLWEKLTKAETARIKMSISQRKGLMYVRVDRDDEGVMTQAVMECRRRGTIEREDLPYKK